MRAKRQTGQQLPRLGIGVFNPPVRRQEQRRIRQAVAKRPRICRTSVRPPCRRQLGPDRHRPPAHPGKTSDTGKNQDCQRFSLDPSGDPCQERRANDNGGWPDKIHFSVESARSRGRRALAGVYAISECLAQ